MPEENVGPHRSPRRPPPETPRSDAETPGTPTGPPGVPDGAPGPEAELRQRVIDALQRYRPRKSKWGR